MIELHWYFWFVAALTLVSIACDVTKSARIAIHDTQENVGYAPSVVGLLWCVHHVLEAVYS